MPATLESYRLAEEHRRDQAVIQREYTKEAATLWVLWASSQGNNDRRQLWLRQNVRLIKDWRQRSERRGLRFTQDAYRLDRHSLVRAPGSDVIHHKPDSVLVRDLLDRSAGVQRRALLAGFDEFEAEEKALAATLASGGRNVQAGGRDAIEQSKPIGWMRVSDGDPCYFCALIISRGGLFKSQLTAGSNANNRFAGEGMFKFHDNCSCTVLPLYSKTDFRSDQAKRFDDLWKSVTRDDEGNVIFTGAEARNEFRKALEAQRLAA